MANPVIQQLNDLKDIAERTLWESTGHLPMPVFDETKESFRTFAQRLNDYMNARQATLADGFRMVPLTLRGAAREAYDRLPVDVQQGHRGWIELLTQIQRGIYTEEKKQEAQIQLSAEKQGTRTVEAYAKACKELAMKAFPEDPAAMEAVLLSTFLNGLKPSIKSQVRRQRPLNFLAAKMAAIHEESILRLDNENGTLQDAINSLTDQIQYLNTNDRNGRERSRERDTFYRSRSIQRDESRGRNGRDYGQRHHSRENRFYGEHRNNYSRGGYRGEHGGYRGGQQGQYHQRGRGQARGRWNGNRGHNGNRGYRGGYNGNRNYQQRQVNAIFDPTVAPSGKSTLPRKATTFLTLCAIIAAFCLPGAEATPLSVNQTFHMCQRNRGGILVVPPMPEECKGHGSTSPGNITSSRVTMFIRNHTLGEHAAFKCTIRRFLDCTSSAFFIGSYNRTFDGFEVPSKEECWDAVNEKSWKGMPLMKIAPSLYETPRTASHPSPTFWGERCNLTRSMSMEKGTLAAITDDIIITTLMLNINECKSQEEQCRNNNSIVVWTAPKKPDPCNFVRIGSYEADIRGDTMVIEAIQSAFVIENRTIPFNISKCFPERVYHTKSGAFFTVHENETEAKQNRPKRMLREEIVEKPHFNTFSKAIRRIRVLAMEKLEPVIDHPGTARTIAEALEEPRAKNKETPFEKLTAAKNTLTGEILKIWSVKYEDVERTVRSFDCANEEMFILHTIARNEIVLTTYTAVSHLAEEELRRRIEQCVKENSGAKGRIALPRNDTNGMHLLALQCAFESIGPGATHPERRLLEEIPEPIRSACPWRTEETGRNERLLTSIRMTMEKLSDRFRRLAPRAYLSLANNSQLKAGKIMEWYRNMVTFWDMMEGAEGEGSGQEEEVFEEHILLTGNPSTTAAATSTTEQTVMETTKPTSTEPTRTEIASPIIMEQHSTRKRSADRKDAAARNSVGTQAHVNYMKAAYDKEEDNRRTLSNSHLNHKLQYTASGNNM